MRYLRAQDLFPAELLDRIQGYVDGEYIYIPRKDDNKRNWGEKTQTREQTRLRNDAIYLDYQRGMNCQALSNKYFLAEKSLQKIIRDQKREMEKGETPSSNLP